MLNIYLSGEIHTDWREEIINLCKNENLNISFVITPASKCTINKCATMLRGNNANNFF